MVVELASSFSWTQKVLEEAVLQSLHGIWVSAPSETSPRTSRAFTRFWLRSRKEGLITGTPIPGGSRVLLLASGWKILGADADKAGP